ncbi:MAG: hypothetical protein NC307_08635 [Roseburia sp.]|nr:hypothetical protein [Roseburia sp.]
MKVARLKCRFRRALGGLAWRFGMKSESIGLCFPGTGENGVSFVATEVGTDTQYLTPEEYAAYHGVLLRAYKENGIGWMYNAIHNILAPRELMWLNSENSLFEDFSDVEDMHGYQVNHDVMKMLKSFQ